MNKKPLFYKIDINKIFKEAIKSKNNNPDLNLPASSYLDKNKTLKKTKK